MAQFMIDMISKDFIGEFRLVVGIEADSEEAARRRLLYTFSMKENTRIVKIKLFNSKKANLEKYKESITSSSGSK